MTIDRRRFMQFTAAAGAFGTLSPQAFAAGDGPEPAVADNGLFVQDWFLESFLELGSDLETAAGEGKHFAVLFEQRGCPYCRELHRVNFTRPEIRDYLDKNFHVLQLDMWGSREVTDFDGKQLEERDLAQRWKVIFTPTMVFFPADAAAVKGKAGGEAEIVRMPGYFKPFHFYSMLEFVHDGHYAKQHFQRFLQDKFKELRAQGKTPEVW